MSVTKSRMTTSEHFKLVSLTSGYLRENMTEELYQKHPVQLNHIFIQYLRNLFLIQFDQSPLKSKEAIKDDGYELKDGEDDHSQLSYYDTVQSVFSCSIGFDKGIHEWTFLS